MSDKRVHYVSDRTGSKATTACGRDAELTIDGAIHAWECSLDGRVVDVLITDHQREVTCRACIKNLSE